MIATPRTGWQTLVADLSIILFMVTAGALSRSATPPAPPAARHLTPPPSMATLAPSLPSEGEALAVYREVSGGPTLATWLGGQRIDPRQQLTIVLRYHAGDEALVPSRFATLFRATAKARVRTRIMAQPGDGPTTAGLAFDITP